MLDASGRNEMKQIALGQGSAFVNTGNKKNLNQHCFLMGIAGQLQLA
jgi:hypothetical protein